MAKITKDMIIGDIIKINMGCVPILLNEGMHCIGSVSYTHLHGRNLHSFYIHIHVWNYQNHGGTEASACYRH